MSTPTTTPIVNLSWKNSVLMMEGDDGSASPQLATKTTNFVTEGGSIKWQIAPGDESGISSIDSITATNSVLFSQHPLATNSWTCIMNRDYKLGDTLYEYSIYVTPTGSYSQCTDPKIKIVGGHGN